MKRSMHISAQDLLGQMRIQAGDFAPLALVSGQVHRVQMCLKHLENPTKNFSCIGLLLWAFYFKIFRSNQIYIAQIYKEKCPLSIQQ